MSENPLDQIPNIEEATPQQMSAVEELAIIKSGYYSIRATLELQFEQTVGRLYQQLLEKNQIISALQKEISDLKIKLNEAEKANKPLL